MPTHVKAFALFALLAVIYAIASAGWYLAFPPQHVIDTLARLPVQFRARIGKLDEEILIVSTIVWSAISLSLIWFAGFRRRNWARWVYAGVVAYGLLLPFGVAASFHLLQQEIAQTIGRDWTQPSIYFPFVFKLAAVAFIFSGDANAWFRTKSETSGSTGAN